MFFFFIFFILLIGDYMNLKVKGFIISILIPVILGLISSLLTMNSMNLDYLDLPSFQPPSVLFPIVWTILYILMGISSYLIYKTYSCYSDVCLLIYIVQLFINIVWPLLFFLFKLRLFSLIWLILLDIVIIYMIICFFGINKKAALLQIPYLLWCLFATFLNYFIYILNR